MLSSEKGRGQCKYLLFLEIIKTIKMGEGVLRVTGNLFRV
jgi:hypothetical protein